MRVNTRNEEYGVFRADKNGGRATAEDARACAKSSVCMCMHVHTGTENKSARTGSAGQRARFAFHDIGVHSKA